MSLCPRSTVVIDGHDDELGAVVDRELVEDVPQVGLHRRNAHEQPLRGLLVGQPGGDVGDAHRPPRGRAGPAVDRAGGGQGQRRGRQALLLVRTGATPQVAAGEVGVFPRRPDRGQLSGRRSIG